MGKLSTEEREARENLTRWFLYFRESFYRREGKPDARFAKDLGLSGRGLVSDVVNGKKTISFDVALKMRRFFKRKLDELVYQPPPQEEAVEPSPERKPGPGTRSGRAQGSRP